MRLRILLAVLVLVLAACSGKPPQPHASQKQAAPTREAAVATPWDGLKQDEQRARDVQKVVDRQAADQRRQIEAAEQ